MPTAFPITNNLQQRTSFSPSFIRGWAGGRVLYVGASGGPEGLIGDGTSIERPLASVFGSDGALKRLGARAGRGDVIYVLPNHTESVAVADAGQYASDTLSGVSICGLGAGDNRPAFTWTAATATVLLNTAGMEIANCRLFLAGAHAAGTAITVAAPITVSGDGCRIVNNDIWWGFDADQIVGDAIIWTGDNGVFAGNRCQALVAAVPSNTFLTLTGADRLYIGYNWIKGATDGTTRGVIDSETTACTDLLIEYNYLNNILASSTIAVSLTSGDTGVARRNDLFVNSGILPYTASELEWHENYVVNGEGEAGALVGTASA